MADRNRQALYDIIRTEGNNRCADCRSDNVEWASCNLGIFLCQDCASIHRSLGVDISRIKSVKLDFWEDAQISKMAEGGNSRANMKFERHFPPYYKRPDKNDPELIRRQFIRAKYERLEFMEVANQQAYSEGRKDGILKKKGKERKDYLDRIFVLDWKDNSIKYYVKVNAQVPKETIPLDDLNVAILPSKMDRPNGLQISYPKDNSVRNLFLACSSEKEAIDWFTAIRCAKLWRRRMAFPERSDILLSENLTRNFLCDGYLYKKGPDNGAYRKRWFTLDGRTLYYMLDPLAPIPKGSVTVDPTESRCFVGNNPRGRGDPLEFVLQTDKRTYELKAESTDDKERWMNALQTIVTS